MHRVILGLWLSLAVLGARADAGVEYSQRMGVYDAGYANYSAGQARELAILAKAASKASKARTKALRASSEARLAELNLRAANSQARAAGVTIDWYKPADYSLEAGQAEISTRGDQ